MSPFDYISVVLSVVIGLGLSHLLSGCVELVQARERVRFYWVHTTWAVLTFVGIVYLWWSIWGLRNLRVWNFASFLLLLLEPVLMFVAAAFLVPKPDEHPLDLRSYYYANRQGIFGAYTAFAALLILQNALLNNRLWNTADWYLLAVLLISAGAIVTTRPWYHAAAAVGFVGWLAAFIAKFGLLLGSNR